MFRKAKTGLLLPFLCLFLLYSGLLASGQSTTFSFLYTFTEQNGAWPNGTGPKGSFVLGTDGNFYGVAGGGSSGNGVVYKLTPQGTETVLHDFPAISDSINTDGAYPTGLIQASDGNFYGTAGGGGANGNGTIFKVTPNGDFSVLYSFSALQYPGRVNPDGGDPSADLVQGSDGNLYGTAYIGGTNGEGTVFKITLSGVFTTLYSFSATDEKGRNDDGALPADALVEGPDGNLYGDTREGGSNASGTIFKITPQGTLTVLSSVFGSADLMLASDGNFYGFGPGGVYQAGTIFRMTPQGDITVFHSFNPYTEGEAPVAPLMQGADGNFYGTTSYGGRETLGTIFQLTPTGKLSVLHLFTRFDGGYPSSNLVQGSNGDFYGSIPTGPVGAGGAVFDLHVASIPPPITDLVFQDTSTGQLGVWFMNDNAALDATAISKTQAPGWQCVGTADFNSDGYPDLVFQNPATGQLALWYRTALNGNTGSIFGGAYIYPRQDPAWQCVSVNDFNLDGKPDLLFQNKRTGQLAIWYMDGNYFTRGAFVYPAQDPAWRCAGSADFNGDGQLDLLFQNQTTGQLALWYLNGNVATGGNVIYPIQDPQWKAVAVGDYNGDGHPDIVFQNPTTGQMAIWYLDGHTVFSAAYIAPSQTAAWTCVGPR